MAGCVVQGEEAVEGVDVEGVAVEVINKVCPCGVLTETLLVHCGSWRRNLCIFCDSLCGRSCFS